MAGRGGGSNAGGASAGHSGSAGFGGSAAGGSSSGNAGSSGTDGAGASGAAASGGNDAASTLCTGCLELRVPFTRAYDTAYFELPFSQPGLDLHDTVATLRLRAPQLDESGQLFLQTFATDSDFTFGKATSALIDAATFTNTETFVDLRIDVGAITTSGFDGTRVVKIGVQVGAGSAFVGPVTVELLLDSVTYTGSSGLTDLNFSADAQGFSADPDVGLQTAEVIHH